MELGDLYREVKAIAKTESPIKKMSLSPRGLHASPETLYSDPKNWTRQRSIALVHLDTQTLLGNFNEFIHNSIIGCRRLVRAKDEKSCAHVEYVTGRWLGVEEKLTYDTKAYTVLQDILCTLTSPPCEGLTDLHVFRQDSAVLRAELPSKCIFTTAEGDAIEFPAGVNIFPHLTREIKILINKESQA
jgi:hypothetical protein